MVENDVMVLHEQAHANLNVLESIADALIRLVVLWQAVANYIPTTND